MKIKMFFALIIAVGFALFACSNSNSEATNKAKATKKNFSQFNKKRGGEFSKVIPVEVTSAKVGDIASFLYFSSNVDAEAVVDIYPMTSGIVEEIYYDEGDFVKKGTILAKLDDREASINEAKARINYEQLKADFNRQKQMFEKKLISKEEFENFKFNYEKAKLDWKQAKLLLSYTRIKTPFDGVIATRYIKKGNKISTSQPAFKVVKQQDKIAVVYIPQEEKKSIYLKQKVFLESMGDTIEGYIKRISPAIDPQSGTFKVTIGIKDNKNVLSVGQFVNVRIVKDIHKDVLLLTKDALIYESDKKFVYIVNPDMSVKKVEIMTGFETPTEVEVVKGLTKDDKVVTAGKNSLREDSKVRIIEKREFSFNFGK